MRRMNSLFFVIFALLHVVSSKVANLVLLQNEREAVCLDGSPPGYYFRQGSGTGASKWIIHLEGGGWCYDEGACLDRSKSRLGSSKSWPATAVFYGFLSDNQDTNPDFYNWNVAFINYCDGASFTGNVNHPVDVEGTLIYFRGFKILQSILSALMIAGMDKSEEVILTGCSAGGLATYFHADYVQGILSPSTKYKTMADAGYIIDIANITGQMYFRETCQYVFKMQNCTSGVNQKCIMANRNEAWKCIMAQYTYPYISSPIFVLNSQYDTWQLHNTLQLKCTPPNCTPEEMEKVEQFFHAFQQAAYPIITSESNGAFLDSCLTHCQSLSDKSWNSIEVGGQSARKTFKNWYFKTSGKSKEVDCPYPCNKSC